MKCKKCGLEINENIKYCDNCGNKNTNYTYFYIGKTPIKVSKFSFFFLMFFGVIVWFVIMFSVMSNDFSNTITETTLSVITTEKQNQDKVIEETHITYENAFNYVKKCEDNIIKNNDGDYNKLKESAAEKIIYSDEYAQLYCSYWSVLEEYEGENDSRFGKSKMRWQVDYSNEEWVNLLKIAFEENGEKALQEEYARIYKEEVFPAVKYRWENGID